MGAESLKDDHHNKVNYKILYYAGLKGKSNRVIGLTIVI
jgi:hypothetical protein